jgi:hypothetical protein
MFVFAQQVIARYQNMAYLFGDVQKRLRKKKKLKRMGKEVIKDANSHSKR